MVEACEYRENFKFLHPDIVVITSVEHDHFDAFPTEEDYFSAFERFVQKAKMVLYHLGDENAERVLKSYKGVKIPVPTEADDGKLLVASGGNYILDWARIH